MSSAQGKVVFITGASSGIGEYLAREYTRRGARTVLVARRTDRIASLAHELGESLAVAGDVTRDGDLEAAVGRALERFGRIDVVIANAGFGVDGTFDTLALDDYRRQFETNVFGVLRTARAASGALADSKGSLAVIGSVSGYLAFPTGGPYSMSKYAVRAFCESLAAEWAPKGVAVTHIAPGFVASEIRKVDREGVLHAEKNEPIPAWLVMPTEKAAKLVVDAIEARAPELVFTGHGRFGVFMARHAPAVVRAVAKVMGRRMKANWKHRKA
jgi:NAD(P)-dependent dehydrogenase (short-subunit alcohol dehydrogenase family)